MIHSGLVSTTFSKLSVEEVVSLVVRSGFEGIEWSANVHVPRGDYGRARKVRQMTTKAKLKVAAYGSYYRVGHEKIGEFAKVLKSALELGAPVVRVWCGDKESKDADEEYVRHIVSESRRVADMAGEKGIVVAYEFHNGTLTDNATSARMILQSVNRENIKTYWQPPLGGSVEYCLEGLDNILPWLLNIHVFHWGKDNERLCLADGRAAWERYLAKARSTGQNHFAMLEFVREDEPNNFLQDALTLKQWLQCS